MLNRRQAEITVMLSRGHSLPVRQSMSVPWEFFTSSHFISQFSPTRFPLITTIRMCHFLPVHQSEWHFWPGRRSKYNNAKDSKMVLDASLLNTQHQKVRIKGKEDQSRESRTHPTPVWSSYRKGSLRVTLDNGCQIYLRWSLNKFSVFFRMSTFIDSTHKKI